jgi:hypothetical protein
MHATVVDGLSDPILESNPVSSSQTDDDIANWLRGANKKVAVGGLFERFRSVDDRN